MQQKITHTHIYITSYSNKYIYITQIICIIIIIGCPCSDKSFWVHHTNFASVIHRQTDTFSLSLSHTDFAYVCISSNTHLLIKMKKREFGKRVCLHENMEGKVQQKKVVLLLLLAFTVLFSTLEQTWCVLATCDSK